MPINSDDMAYTRYRCELDGHIVEDRHSIRNSGEPVGGIDGVERAPEGEVTVLIVGNVEDNELRVFVARGPGDGDGRRGGRAPRKLG
jgi:hypothetical protein